MRLKNLFTIVSLLLFIFLLASPDLSAKKQVADEPAQEETSEEEQTQENQDEDQTEEDEKTADEEYTEEIDEEPPPEEIGGENEWIKKPAIGGPANIENQEEARGGEEIRDIILDSLITLNYLFDYSQDSFQITYSLHFEGKINAKVAVINGEAQIAAEVKGFLAKWPKGNCKLVVTIPDTPYGMTFRKSSEENASLNIKFTRPITETWESQCTFSDTPEAKFNTKGDPEKWLAKAILKARPPLSRISVPISPEQSTTMKFEISKETLTDPPLGSAEVEGKGVITIRPATAD